MIVVMRPTVGENTINFVKSNLEKCGVEVNVSQGGRKGIKSTRSF